ncbi:hypothetical protein [Prevotella sp.]
MTVVIRDQYGNVIHQSTQTITPMESMILFPTLATAARNVPSTCITTEGT